jgi:hypothetical protein
MTARTRSIAVGVFHDQANAQQAINELRKAGFQENQLGVVARHSEEIKGGHPAGEKGSKIAKGATTGALAGAGVGALWALGIAANVLPGIGPVISGGILASVIASAAGGAAIAGVVGALVGLGVPEDEAKYYEGEFKAGRTVVTVKADGRYDEALSILRRNGAYDMTTAPSVAAMT